MALWQPSLPSCYGNFYGTPKQAVFNKLDQGEDVVLEIDIQGALKIKEVWPKGVFIFILPPSMTELRKRITGRGSESQSDIDARIGEALKEVSYIDKYDYCVVNDQVDWAVEKIMAIINAEHYRVSEDIYSLIENYKEEL
jgi:guanylate kinase